jgi:DNA-binding NtrC family response regulator
MATLVSPDDHLLKAAWSGVRAAFGSLGRVCIGLDQNFRIRRAAERLDELAGPGASKRFVGRPIAELLGEELFGEAGALRRALLSGERREGWRASVRVEPEGSRVASVTVAPLIHDGACDPATMYLVVLRPVEEEVDAADALTSFGGLLGRAPSMRRIFQLVQNLENSDATVLLTGESGTGKELVARAIHVHSTQRDGPFIAVNCGAVPGDLLESELFGHARGAFTGAVRDRVGRVELAAKGTLFLDEVGDLPTALQVKLLRLLQERSFERVGESHSRHMSARIIAATNVDLARALAAGRFREDLYYRLRVVPIVVPPLRERREDVEPLARHLLHRVAARNGRHMRLSPDALRTLLAYPWPGNVRELENALEYAVAVCRGPNILPEDLPAEVQGQRGAAELQRPGAPQAGDERASIEQALTVHHWSREGAARALGISRTTLWRKMRELGVQR